MKRSSNRFNYRGSYGRGSGNRFSPFNNNYNQSSQGSRVPGSNSNNGPFQPSNMGRSQQNQHQLQKIPSLMSSTIPSPFGNQTSHQQSSSFAIQTSLQQSSLVPPPYANSNNPQQPPSIPPPFVNQNNQQHTIQNILVQTQQQSAVYYALMNANASGSSAVGQNTLPPWASTQNILATAAGTFTGGFNQQAFLGQPPLPQSPQQPNPPAPSCPSPLPPPEPMPSTSQNNFNNNSSNDRSIWNRNHGGKFDGNSRNRNNRFNRNSTMSSNSSSSGGFNQRNRDILSPNHRFQRKPFKFPNPFDSDASSSSPFSSTLSMRSRKDTPQPETMSWVNTDNDDDDDDDDSVYSITTVNRKSKRKPMSAKKHVKEWNAEYATQALNMEKAVASQKTPMLILKFPDPELNKDIVKGYSPLIEHVHFQQPSTSRYCFIQLKRGADVAKIKDELCEIPFGAAKIVADYKNVTHTSPEAAIEDIDPYTIYVGNLPTTVSVNRVKTFFPNAARIDIGFAQRMKYTRYAFVRYNTCEESFAAFRGAFDIDLGPRSLVLRFRRTRGNIGLNPNNAEGDGSRLSAKRKRQQMMEEEAMAADGGSFESLSENQHDFSETTEEREKSAPEATSNENSNLNNEPNSTDLDPNPTAPTDSVSCSLTSRASLEVVDITSTPDDLPSSADIPSSMETPTIKTETDRDSPNMHNEFFNTHSENWLNEEIKQECDDDFDDDFDDYFDDMPTGDDDFCDGDDDLMANDSDLSNGSEKSDIIDKKPQIKLEQEIKKESEQMPGDQSVPMPMQIPIAPTRNVSTPVLSPTRNVPMPIQMPEATIKIKQDIQKADEAMSDLFYQLNELD